MFDEKRKDYIMLVLIEIMLETQ